MNKRRLKIPMREYVSLLSDYLKPQWKSMAWLGILLSAGIAMQLVNPQIIRYFIDTAQTENDASKLLYAAVLFIGISLLNQGVNVVSAYIGENVGWIATNRLRGDVAAHCLKLDMSFHKSHTSGAVIERVDGDINNLANFFSSFVITLLSNLVLMAGILVLLFRENVWIGLGLTVFVLFAMFMIQHIRKYAVPLWGKMRKISAEFYGFLGEHLEGTEDTRANGATGYVMYRYFSLLREWLPVRIRAFLGWASMWTTSILVFALGTASAFAICASLWYRDMITIGTVYMVFYYTDLLSRPIEKIRMQLEDLQKADASITRVKELMDTETKIKDGRGEPIPPGALSVHFDGVTFGYEDAGNTLTDIHFRLEKGKVLGLLGRTGSGKSTMARLLLRFYDPRSGAVRLNGVDLRDAHVRDVRNRVGFVTQSIEIFQASVRDNLTFYDPSIPDEAILEVLVELGLRDWFRSLPVGLDTVLESGGGGLSAGEAQLLAFARVFLSDPGLVILDEASSRLDPATEQRLERAVNRLLEGRTCIIIAHRLGTIQRADDILILEDGHVLEQGDRQRLAADPNSRFSRIMETGLEEVLA